MTDKKTTPVLTLGRPADRSLEAFKAWMNAMADKLMPGSPDDITEDEWVESHKQFWEGVDRGLEKLNKQQL